MRAIYRRSPAQRAPTKKPICAVAEMGFEKSVCSATGQPAALSFEFSHHQFLFNCAFMGLSITALSGSVNGCGGNL
jgi:hypothetical protein